MGNYRRHRDAPIRCTRTSEKYLRKLFEFAFEIGKKDGLIRLPGQYSGEPSTAVLADLQQGLVLTFLQHGKVRKLAKEPTTATYDPEGEGMPGVETTYRKCSGFKHQEGWQEFVGSDGCLTQKTIRLDGPISPGVGGAACGFYGPTRPRRRPAGAIMLPLYCIGRFLTLAVNRGVAVLLVPEVENLNEFVFDRQWMTPTTAVQTQVANAADAALQSQWRLRNNQTRATQIRKKSRDMTSGSIRGIYAMTFTPTTWASQQKSRVAAIHVPAGDDLLLDRFARALALLPLRIVPPVKETTGKGKSKTTVERKESFRADSIVRPLVAENLALGRKWLFRLHRLDDQDQSCH